ncbi:MAG: polysaccharide biosynthesis tyrosine autokinase, partial [bacterium]|nr:polysaccharide biosynthesis tyrosine autokinase [bacterium]
QALKREADGDKTLYEELVRKIREKTINASFENSSARIADPGRPGREPVFPNIPLSVLVAFLLSSVAAVGLAVVSDILDDTIRDPEEVSRTLGYEVVGSLPEVKPWRNQLAKVAQNGSGDHPKDGASSAVTGYDEAIRTLRNSILLADFDRRLRTMLVTSAAPSEGKSTIAIHLAISHAQQNKRTLLIDGDLRRPSVHRRFDLGNQAGLSNALNDQCDWRKALLTPETEPNLDILPAGSLSHRRVADLIGPGLSRVLEEASGDYDLVIVDAPPLLGFSEPLQMATAVDGVVITVRAGQTSRKAVGPVLGTLTRPRANVVGVVLNEVTHKLSDRYYYGYYHKYYRYYRAKPEPRT